MRMPCLPRLPRSAAPLLLGFAALCVQGPAWAAKASAKTPVKATVQATTSGQAGNQPLPGSVRFIDAPSSEKPAARERRLKRECKGRPNAGVCLGYTR